MDKKEKLGFFEKIFLAITDFRVYPFLLRHEKLINSIMYMVAFVLLMSAILTFSLFSKINVVFEELISNYDLIIPDFEFENSKLNVNDKIAKEINSKSYLVIDTTYSYNQLKQAEEYENLFIYDSAILITSDKIVMEADGESIYELSFSDATISTNKAELFELLSKYQNDPMSKFRVFGYLYLTIVITYIFVVLIRVIFIALIASIISLFFGIKASFSNYIKLAIYAYTLPFIIEIISVCILGTIKDYAYYTSLALTYVYILYALRAVKLDAFLTLIGSDKNLNNKMQEKENDNAENSETNDDDKTDKEK